MYVGPSGDVARQLSHYYASSPSSAVVIPPTAGGTAAPMDGSETEHWLRLVVLKAEAAGKQAVSQVAPLATTSQLEQPFQVRHICVAHVGLLSAMPLLTNWSFWACFGMYTLFTTWSAHVRLALLLSICC